MGSHWDLMCKSHKSEISSLVLCTLHQKLADVHGMCENCLFSFATKDKSNPETYRLLVGKLRLDPENDVDEKPQSKGTKVCCCCNEPWSSRSHAQELLKTKSIELERDDVPLTREFRLNWNSLKKENKRPIFVAARSDVHEGFEDCSPHFGYSELKLDSDSESEDQMCDTEEPKPRVLNVSSQSSNLTDHEESQSDLIKSHDTTTLEKPIFQDSTLLEPPNLIDNWMKPQEDTVPEKPVAPDAPVLEHPNLIDHESSHSDVIESIEAPSTLPTSVGHGLEELNWQDIDLQTESSPASDSINTDKEPESPNAVDIQVDRPKDHAASDQKEIEAPIEVEQIPKPENIERVNEAEKGHPTTDVLDSKVNNNVNDGGGVQPTNNLELGDAYKLAVSTRGRQLSSKSLEQLIGKDSPRVSQDLKLLLSQLSGLISPRMSGNPEDSRALIGMQLLQKRISLERNDSRNSLERNESGFESLDVSIVGEIEGESEVDRLKRQIEFDKKFMSGLYKELEEERNASAVAANQALAMITRLQEEKAALQMEALHDIRMMEDQAEYDVEALDRANEILAEKEREIQDLEAELDYYRIKYPDDELMLENEDSILDSRSPKSSWLGFEDERFYISQKLSNLEKKLHLFSNCGIYPDLQNEDCFNMEEEKKTGKKDDGDDDDVILQTNNPASFGDRRSLVRRVNSIKTPRSIVQDSTVHKEADAVDLGYEVSTLNERLQTLEADRNFLENAINSLRNGEEGVRFIQEIACHLRELRRVGIKRKQSLA